MNTCPGPPAQDSTDPACGRPVYAKGLCRTHRGQQMRGRELFPIRTLRTGCDQEGCDGEHHGHGLCRYHFDTIRPRPDGTPRKRRPRRSTAPKAKDQPVTRKPSRPADGSRPTLVSPKPAPGMPRGWDKVTKPKPPTTARRTGGGSAQSVLTDALIPLPLDMLAKAVAVVDKLGARDCLDALGIRELHHARTVWAERTGCAA